MNCVLMWLSTCIIDPNSFAVTVDLYQPFQQPVHEGAWCGQNKTGHWCKGPRAELSFGVSVTLPRGFRADYGIRHTSFIMENDRGVEGVYLRLVWKPAD